MRQIYWALFLLLLLSSCVLKKEPTAPTLNFKSGVGYIPEGSSVDTNALIKIGLEAQKTSSDMRYLQIERRIDSNTAVLFSSVLTAASKTSFDKDFECRTAVSKTIHTEQYFFKVSDDNGFTFEKNMTLKVDPAL